MTLAEALTLTTGDVIRSAGLPDCGRPPMNFKLTSVQPARPELDYSPSIYGRKINDDGTLANHHTMTIILNGDTECVKALGYWTK